MALLHSAFSHRILQLCSRAVRTETSTLGCAHRCVRWTTTDHPLQETDQQQKSADRAQKIELNDNEEPKIEELIKFKAEDQPYFPKSSFKPKDICDNLSAFPHDDPDSFGNLSGMNALETEVYEGDEGDRRDDEFLSFKPERLPQKKYVQMIQKFLSQRRFADALNVLQVRMLKVDRVKPEYYIYSILISFCGKVGYTETAFRLYREMRKRQLHVTPAIYTSLFNACSNSPSPKDGLRRALALRTHCLENNVELNDIICHAMIKAFGKCGDLSSAFQVGDYMMENKITLKTETFSFLFFACISDKEAGFRHALLVYRKMIQYKIYPDTYIFNLLLRCVRETKLGDFASVVNVFDQLGVDCNKLRQLQDRTQLQLNSDSVAVHSSVYPWEEDPEVISQVISGYDKADSCKAPAVPSPQSALEKEARENSVNEYTSTNLLPNLFAHPPTLGSVVSMSDLKDHYDRLFLLGGVKGFLNEMAKHNAKPDIKTASLLLECVPPSCDAENTILSAMKDLNVQLGIGFFNTLIKRRAHRRQYQEAKDVVSLIAQHGADVDLITFCGLAMTCRSHLQACELLKSMEEAGFRPNIEIVTALMRAAFYHYNFKYIELVFEIIAYEEMPVDSQFMKILDVYYERWKNGLAGRGDHNKRAIETMRKFCANYPEWKKNLKVEEENHPWEQFKQEYPATDADEEFLTECVEPEKLKRLQSVFPRKGPKTSIKLRDAKIRRLKELQPELFMRKPKRKLAKQSNEVEGIEMEDFQKLQVGSPSKPF